MDIFNLSDKEKDRLNIAYINKSNLSFKQEDTYLHLCRARWMSEDQMLKGWCLEGPSFNEGVQIQGQGISLTRLSIEQLQVLAQWISQLPNIKLDPNAI